MQRHLVFSVLAILMISLAATAISHGQGGGEMKPLGAALEIIRHEPKANQSPSFVFSPDGKLFAYNWDNAIHIFDLKASKEIRVLGDRPKGGWLERTAISPSGAEALAAYRTTSAGELWLWSLATGKPLRALEYNPPKDLLETQDTPIEFTPDGKAVIGVLKANGISGFQIWDVGTGKRTRSIWGGLRAFRFCEDGKTLIAEQWDHIRDEHLGRSQTLIHYKISLRLWEFSSGSDLRQIGPSLNVTFKGKGAKMAEGSFPPGTRLAQLGLSRHGARVRISPMDRIMVFPRDPKDAVLEVKGKPAKLFDLATGKELPQVKQLDEFGFPPGLGLSLDSRKLAVGGEPKEDAPNSHKSTILLLDVSRWGEEALKARKEPTAKELVALWADLGSEEPMKALQASRRMRASPQTVLTFLKEKVRPVAYDSKKIDAYLLQIDDKSYKVREQAEKELLRLAEHAEAAIKKTLLNPASLEAQTRLQRILDTLTNGTWPPAPTRRLLWGIEFLELDGGPAAIELLKQLSTGAPEAWVTLEASATLQRLENRNGVKK